ncbi:MAG: Single-strand DNA-binding protein [Leptospirillum rubarum]|uniref:Single-stranded DNA-binding protein n=1 Tax=Leptospirillum sp. Group II '5-way CG' TaxID=419541 RepID=B6AP78_9BACT|nr:MAG: Single-strand DNA-binding protein [Leptospirillum rubarum]EDZ39064.1 MAG: Single-strand DNA-binding protein [Leptospirillum sp. Group II '5-way CG']
MNKVLLVGRIGQDPEIRFSPAGTVFARLTLATERNRKVDGKWVSEPDWHTVIQIAKTLSSVTAKKGDLVAVEGEIRSRSWDKDGEKRWATEVVTPRIRVLTKNKKDKSVEESVTEPISESLAAEELDSSEIPF